MNEIFMQIIDFFQTKQGIVSLVILVIGAVWQYWRFAKEWNFKNYHKLIKELNQSDTPKEPIKLYRQVAVVYELRNYPRYFSVSKRILQEWIDSKSDEDKNKFIPLYKEMELCIEFMNKKFWKRWLDKIYKK